MGDPDRERVPDRHRGQVGAFRSETGLGAGSMFAFHGERIIFARSRGVNCGRPLERNAVLCFHSLRLVLGGRTLPVSLLARDGVLIASCLDLAPDEARAVFAGRGLAPESDDPGPVREMIADLRRYEAGESDRWRSQVRFEIGTPFQRAVWERIAEIPSGETRTYAELAAEVGSTGGARAAGSACGRNPIPLRIPCHRVVAAEGGLGGFTGRIETKRALLEHEGAVGFHSPLFPPPLDQGG